MAYKGSPQFSNDTQGIDSKINYCDHAHHARYIKNFGSRRVRPGRYTYRRVACRGVVV